jgi:hypothetical protein
MTNSIKKSMIFAVLLFLAPALFLNAQQSFYVSSGRTIKNGGIADGYCLEQTQKTISNGNISGLLNNIEGMVRVIYTDGTSVVKSLQNLVNDGQVYFNAFDSYRNLQFFFAKDSGIEALVTGEDGAAFIRKGISGDDEKLARENIKKIRALETQKLLHHTIQRYIWRTRLTTDIPAEGVRAIDFRTTSDPAGQVRTRFGGNATVDYRRNGQKFMRLDGILNQTVDFGPEITELVSHFHNDHINLASLETLLKEKDFDRLFAPYAYLDSSRNRIFELLEENRNGRELKFKQENRILEITDMEKPFAVTDLTGSIGDFYYAAFEYDADISVVIYKYKKPKDPKDPNTDGVIYQISHKDVSFLLFGDFDDPAGIKNLLEASAENERKQNEVDELKSVLRKREYEYEYESKNAGVFAIGVLFASEGAKPDDETLNRLESLKTRLEELENGIIGLEESIYELEDEIIPLPPLKADVVKWPHHAHLFEEKDREVIIKLNEVVDPYYFIYQVHSAQDLKKFETFIKDFNFSKKFINSGVQPVEFISLEWIKAQFRGLFTGKPGKTS